MIEELRKQAELWENISGWSQNRIGAVEFKRDKTELSKAFPLTLFETELDPRTAVRRLPSNVEYAKDGLKTTAIIAKNLYDTIIEQMPPDIIEIDELIATQKNLRETINEATNLLKTKGFPYSGGDAWVTEPDSLDKWLLEQPLHQTSPQVINNQWFVADSYPFIVFKQQREKRNLAKQPVYWLESGLQAVYYNNVYHHHSRWDSARLQLTLDSPYILVCNGVLGGGMWADGVEIIAQKIRAAQQKNSKKPVLIILADGIREKTTITNKDFYTLVLPTPRDEQFGTDNIPARPQLQAMADIFGTQVVNLWLDIENPKARPDWQAVPLGVCQIALIDRQRTLLVPQPNSGLQEGMIDSDEYVLSWQARDVNALTLPIEQSESVSEAELLMRWRIEVEDGIVAGGGAAYHWLSYQLQDAEVASWVAEALRAPMKQILANAGILIDNDVYVQIDARIQNIDAPTDTFLIDRERTFPNDSGEAEMIHDDPRIWLGETGHLGLLTPLPEALRVIAEATQLAWKLALLYYMQERPD